MRKFINFFGMFILIIIAVVLVLPLGMSFWLNKNYQQILDHFNRSPSVTIKLVKFDRGWFVSHARIQVVVSGQWLDAENNPIKLDIDQRIMSGPFLFGKIAAKQPRLFFAKALIYSNCDAPQFTFRSHTLIHFSNDIESVFAAKKIGIIHGQQQYSADRFVAKFSYYPVSRQVLAKIKIAAVTLAKGQSTVGAPQTFQPMFILYKFVMNSDLRLQMPLWYGTRSITIEKLTYFDTHNKPTYVNNIDLRNEQSQTNESTNIVFSAHAASVENDWLQLKPVDVQYDISGVNTKALTELADSVLHMQWQSSMGLEQLKSLYVPAVRVLSRGVVIKLNRLNAGTEDGMVSANAQIISPPQIEQDNLAALLANIQGQFSLIMPQKWLIAQLTNLYQNRKLIFDDQEFTPSQAAQQQVQYWLTNKKVIADGPTIKLNVSYDKGQFLINDLSPSYRALQPVTPIPPASTNEKHGETTEK